MCIIATLWVERGFRTELPPRNACLVPKDFASCNTVRAVETALHVFDEVC